MVYGGKGVAKPGCANSSGNTGAQEEQVTSHPGLLLEVQDLVILGSRRELQQTYPVSWAPTTLASVWTTVSTANVAELRAEKVKGPVLGGGARSQRAHGPEHGGRKAPGGAGRPL